jgi:hypothetical protein
MSTLISCPLTESQKLEMCREFSLAVTLLLRSFYKAYGEDCLTVVKDFGKTLSDGFYEKNKHLKNRSLKEIVMPFFCLIESLGGGPIEILEDSENKIIYRIDKCPSGFECTDVDDKLCRTLNILEENYASRMGIGYTFIRRRSSENNTCEKCFFQQQ